MKTAWIWLALASVAAAQTATVPTIERHRELEARVRSLESRVDDVDEWIDSAPGDDNPDDPTDPSDPAGGIIISAAEIQQLPASGEAWEYMVRQADQDMTPDLADQESSSPARAFAAALVFARTGDNSYRQRVAAALSQVPDSSRQSGVRVLSLGRQLGGWIIAADLIDYREPEFVQFVDEIRTRDVGGHGRWTVIADTHRDSANNWGVYCGAARMAASAYLDDQADLEKCFTVLRGYLGTMSEWPGLSQSTWQQGQGFRATKAFHESWICGESTMQHWRPINRCDGPLDGAIVDDVDRGGTGPVPDGDGIQYSWSALQALTLQCLIAERAGFAGVWEWEGQAVRRAADFLRRNNGFSDENWHWVGHHIAPILNAKYGTTYPTPSPSRHGRSIGFTDWLTDN